MAPEKISGQEDGAERARLEARISTFSGTPQVTASPPLCSRRNRRALLPGDAPGMGAPGVITAIDARTSTEQNVSDEERR
jgi:hypothetical protein